MLCFVVDVSLSTKAVSSTSGRLVHDVRFTVLAVVVVAIIVTVHPLSAQKDKTVLVLKWLQKQVTGIVSDGLTKTSDRQRIN